MTPEIERVFGKPTRAPRRDQIEFRYLRMRRRSGNPFTARVMVIIRRRQEWTADKAKSKG